MGLTQCQARSKKKIHFHLNASLTAVSVAKAANYLELTLKHGKQDQTFSLVDMKNQYANELLLERFISTFGINPNLSKIKSLREAVTNFGRMAVYIATDYCFNSLEDFYFYAHFLLNLISNLYFCIADAETLSSIYDKVCVHKFYRIFFNKKNDLK